MTTSAPPAARSVPTFIIDCARDGAFAEGGLPWFVGVELTDGSLRPIAWARTRQNAERIAGILELEPTTGEARPFVAPLDAGRDRGWRRARRQVLSALRSQETRMFAAATTRLDSLMGLTLLFAFVGWLAAIALASSTALERRGLPYALLALVVGVVAGPLALLWARRLRVRSSARATDEPSLRESAEGPRLSATSRR